MSLPLPAVTIGIPFLNASEDLLNAVRSVFAQTHTDWELLLIDDGSTDNSLALAELIDDPRVHVYSDGRNCGLAARLNQITRMARYDFVARMDADDLVDPSRLERQLSEFIANPDLDLVSTGVYSLDNACVPRGMRCMPMDYVITPKSLLYGNCGIVNASVLARREWFLRNPFNESLSRAQDANLWIKAYDVDDLKVSILSEPLYFYREDNNVNVKRALEAYKVVRWSVVQDATRRYRFVDRIAAYLRSLLASSVVVVLEWLGRMDIIRERRLVQMLGSAERALVIDIIADIKSTKVPLK